MIIINIYNLATDNHIIYLTLEDLIPNALIELIENNVTRTVSYPTISHYGSIVVKELKKRNKDSILQIHRDSTTQFEDEHKDLFDFFEIDNIRYIKLKDNIDSNYLRKRFRIHQSIDSLSALTSDDSKQALGITT